MRGTQTSGWANALALVSLAGMMILEPTLGGKLPDRKLPDCDKTGNWDEPGFDMGTFWYDTGAEQYADEYISLNGDHTQWAKRLYADLFVGSGKKADSEMSCGDDAGTCDHDLECADFNEIGKGGLFYLFESFRNLHNFLKGARSRFDESTNNEVLKTKQFKDVLKVPEDDKGDHIKSFLTILSAALGMGAAGVSVVNPGFGGALAAFGGLSTIVGEATGSDTSAEANISEELDWIVGQIREQTQKSFDTIRAGVYGTQKLPQTVIPEHMRAGGTKNPAVQVFGFGNWVMDQTDSLQKWEEEFRFKLSQAVLWRLAAKTKGAYVIVRDDLDSKEKCDSNVNHNNGWDEEKGRCYDLMIWNQKAMDDDSGRYYFGGTVKDEGLEDVWGEPFHLDRVKTMRNAVECWEQNNGKPGEARPNDDVLSGDYPPCFFAIEVHKGSFGSKPWTHIELDDKFPGQTERPGKEGVPHWWPRNTQCGMDPCSGRGTNNWGHW